MEHSCSVGDVFELASVAVFAGSSSLPVAAHLCFLGLCSLFSDKSQRLILGRTSWSSPRREVPCSDARVCGGASTAPAGPELGLNPRDYLHR